MRILQFLYKSKDKLYAIVFVARSHFGVSGCLANVSQHYTDIHYFSHYIC